MWLGHDLSWWSFVVSVSALVLCIPLTVFGNILTPKLLNWWAERSIFSTRNRITALEKQLSDYEQFQPLSEAEDWILRGIESLGMMGVYSMVVLADLMLTIWDRTHLTGHQVIRLDILALFTAVMAFVFMFIHYQQISTFRLKRSPVTRKYLRNSIDRLKNQLASKQ